MQLYKEIAGAQMALMTMALLSSVLAVITLGFIFIFINILFLVLTKMEITTVALDPQKQNAKYAILLITELYNLGRQENAGALMEHTTMGQILNV